MVPTIMTRGLSALRIPADLKLLAIMFEFARAMPMAVICVVEGKEKGTKRKGEPLPRWWLGRFRLDLSMAPALEFVRAMAVNIVDGMTGNGKGEEAQAQ
ncbi:hypothetical protein THAOC_05555, partial [Thalassiosira oceanica]